MTRPDAHTSVHGCPGAPTCNQHARCPEHRIDVDPESVGDLLGRLFGTPETTAPTRSG